MISDSHRFVFVHIPRTAGTSVETALASYARTRVTFTAHECTVLADKHASARELAAIVGASWPSYRSFSIVRDPWERMLSDYHFFLAAGPLLYPEFSPRERRLTDEAAEHGFDDWLHRNADHLAMSQTDYLTDESGRCIVEHILRFEALAEDFARITSLLGISCDLPCLNRTEHPSPREAYSAAGVELVRRRCAADLRSFGYRFGGA